MIEQFNRINRAFGANRVRLSGFSDDQLLFFISCMGLFGIQRDGSIMEIYKNGLYGTGVQFRTESARSKWLKSISLGEKRDDYGNLVDRKLNS